VVCGRSLTYGSEDGFCELLRSLAFGFIGSFDTGPPRGIDMVRGGTRLLAYFYF